MKSWFSLSLILCGTLLSAAPQTLFDFSKDSPEAKLHSPEKKKQSATYQALQDGQPGLWITWDNAAARHFEFSLPPQKLPEFDTAELRVQAYLPEGGAIGRISVRFRDKDGEIFQFSTSIDKKESGWQTLTFPIEPAPEKPECWYGGKKANKRIDFPVAFTGIAAGFGKKDGEGSVGIRQIDFQVTSQSPIVALETGSISDLHLLIPGEEDRLGFRVQNRRPDHTVFDLSYTVTDLSGKELARKTLSIPLEAGAETFLRLPRPEHFGVYPVSLTWNESGKEPVTQSMRFGYMSPAGPTPDIADSFYFGLCAHPQRMLTQQKPEEMKREIKAAALCGADQIRMDIGWGRVEPKQGESSYALYDPIVEELERYHMKLAPILNYPPRWAFAEDWKEYAISTRGVPFTNLTELDRFVRATMARYHGKFLFVEFLNEPDHSGFGNFTAEKYVEMLAVAYDAIKAVDPEVKVMSGGLAGLQKDELIARLIFESGKFDCFPIHGHGSLGGFRPQVKLVQELLANHSPRKTWYANETAISALHVGELRQAQTLFLKLIYAWANGAIGYNWYDLRNDGMDPKNNEHNFGLVTYDFYPKAGYIAYNMLASVYRNGTFHSELQLGENLEGYLFRAANGDWLLGNWSVQPGVSGTPVLLANVTGEATQIDLFGNETALSGSNGFLGFEVGWAPTTLRIRGQETPPVSKGVLLRQSGELSTIVGEARNFQFEVFNPTKQTLTITATVTPPERIAVSPATQTVSVEPGKQGVLTLQIEAQPGFISPPSAPKQLALNLKAGNLWQGTVTSQLRNIVSIPVNDFRSEPDFQLDSPDQIISFVTNAPDMLPHFWKDANDLSAEIRLARTAQELLVRVDVRDNVHHQPFNGNTTWKADSVQLALHLPGQPSIWEFGFARLDDGREEAAVWLTPPGFSAEETVKNLQLKTERNEQSKVTTYYIVIPLQTIGLNSKIGRQGFRFNLLVNDNDGAFRKNAIGITPGIAEEKSSAQYVLVDFGK